MAAAGAGTSADRKAFRRRRALPPHCPTAATNAGPGSRPRRARRVDPPAHSSGEGPSSWIRPALITHAYLLAARPGCGDTEPTETSRSGHADAADVRQSLLSRDASLLATAARRRAAPS